MTFFFGLNFFQNEKKIQLKSEYFVLQHFFSKNTTNLHFLFYFLPHLNSICSHRRNAIVTKWHYQSSCKLHLIFPFTKTIPFKGILLGIHRRWNRRLTSYWLVSLRTMKTKAWSFGCPKGHVKLKTHSFS